MTTIPPPTTADSNNNVIILDWSEIATTETSPTLLRKLEQALGSSGIGLIGIRNVPNFVQAKQAFLPQAHALVHLPAEYLDSPALTDEASLYNAGWSYGKEKLGDKPDLAKGSFYYNPVTDVPGTAADRHKYPYSYPANKWPEKMPTFRQAAMTMGMILTEATVQLAKHVDALALTKCADYESQFLYTKMKDADKVKARLLYYFPLNKMDGKDSEKPAEAQDSWIGWHNDSGYLTALAGDLYVRHDTGEIVPCPDPNAGLYVTTATGQTRRIQLPPDCMAVQIGECTQIVTAGVVRATPHCVRGAVAASGSSSSSSSNNIARIALAVFVDAPPYQPLSMPRSASRQQVLQASIPNPKVPPLGPRWTGNDMTFGEFLQKTFQQYYDWKPQPSNDDAAAADRKA